MIVHKFKEEIERYVKEGWGGRLLASYYASVIDNVFLELMPSFQKDLPFAIFATGSYGREELCLYSDIDIMFFLTHKNNTDVATELLYKLWDSGLYVSHSFRTPHECLEDAFGDPQIRTSLLEARFVCGNPNLELLYHEEVLQKLRARKKKEFISMKLREIYDRHRKEGNSPFLLQPNVKESRGGLRDIQSALWLTSVLFRYDRIQCFNELLNSDDYNKYLRSYDFLLRLRFVIHLLSGRKNDKLLFELQDDTASVLGFKKSKKFSAIERMMRYYFIKAGAISTYSDKVFRICGEMITQKNLNFTVRKINDAFLLSRNKVIAKTDAVINKNPLRIMEAFRIYANTGFKLSEHLIDTIKRNIIYITESSRINKKMRYYFFSILKSKRVYYCLRIMHETGVLGKYIPEFGSLRYLLVNDYYHEYPVDEHSLICIKRLELIEKSKEEGLESLSEILRKIMRKDLLYFSLLLHDIGKAKGQAHEREGYKGIKIIADRLSIHVESREFVEFLVKNHTLMSDTAFKHDIDSPDVISYFAERVANEERLNALYLVTYADISSVNDRFWTPWRASLLNNLYMKTKDYLGGVRLSRRIFVENLFEAFRDLDEINEFIQVMPHDYLISSPREKIMRESAVYKRATNEGFAVHIEDQKDGTTEITVSVRDRRGIFSDIVSVFAVRRLNIIEARLFTSENGLAIDRITISNWKELWWDGVDELIESDLKNVLLLGKKITFWDRSKHKRIIESFIEADQEKGENYTIIEIMATDRLGFLYEVTQVLNKNNINIISGKIYTDQNIANDVFYVNIEGRKLTAECLYRLIGDLWESIRYQIDI